MTALSYANHTNTAMCELVQGITHPDQHLASLQAAASSFLVLDVGYHSTLLTNAAFLLSSINLVRRDYYMKGLHGRTRAVPKLTRMLRFAPLCNDTLFGASEDKAIELLNNHNQRQATSNLAKAPDKSSASARSSRPKSRSDKKHQESRPSSRPRHEPSLQIDVTNQCNRKVKFDKQQPQKDNHQPFRGGRRGRGRGGRSGGNSRASSA